MKLSFSAALLSAVALTNTAYAQEFGSKALGITVGPSVFAAPDLATGVTTSGSGHFSQTSTGRGAGINIGVSVG